MSFHEELNNLYAKQIAGKSILVNENKQNIVNEAFPPYEAGEYGPNDPIAREKMLALAKATHRPKSEGSDELEPIAAYQGQEKEGYPKGTLEWRFYLAFLDKWRNMTPRQSVQVAAAIASQILDKLSESPDGRFMGTNVEFRDQIVKPIIARMIPEMSLGDIKEVPKTYLGYIARAITTLQLNLEY